MSFALAPLSDLALGVVNASERFWGLGPVGLGVVIFLTIFIVVVVAWLLHNTGRWD